MNHPQVKRFLREREQRYLDNLKWLDEDLAQKKKEEEDKPRIQEENISPLDKQKTEKEDCEAIGRDAEMPEKSVWKAFWYSEDSSSDEDNAYEKVSPSITHPSKSTKRADHCPRTIRNEDGFQKSTKSLRNGNIDDTNWKIKRKTID
jgi:hypothetical protein